MPPSGRNFPLVPKKGAFINLKRTLSAIIVVVFLFSMISISTNEGLIPRASAMVNESAPRVYEWNLDGEKVTISYYMRGTVVVEKTTIIENNKTVSVITREVKPSGELTLYHNGVLKNCESADYSMFFAVVQNGISLLDCDVHNTSQNNRTVYQVCGSTLPHELVATTSGTIDTRVTAIGSMSASSLAGYLISSFSLLEPYAGVIVAATTIYSIMHSDTPCEYVDITEYKYFVHDYSLNQSKNCFHTYIVCYNITSTGARQVVDAQWKCSQVIL